MRKITLSASLTVLLIATSFSVRAQDAAAIQQKLVSEYTLTQPTAANDDIVTPGAVLVLKKSKVVMVPVSDSDVCQNTYKNGKITQNPICKTFIGHQLPGAPATRAFVPGEKMWVTKIEVKQDGVVFDLFTDAYSDVRYKAALKFQFPKGPAPSVADLDKTVSEVFGVQAPAEDAKTDAKQQAPATEPSKPGPVTPPTPQQPSEPTPAPIAPPPPPPADPKTIALKQTTDEVVANFGQPDKIIKLGAKQIYVYKDMKVTFVNGKVTDVQ